MQHLNSGTFVARAKWKLSQVLEKGPEASQLQKEALEYLNTRLMREVSEDEDLSELFDSQVFYWSRWEGR